MQTESSKVCPVCAMSVDEETFATDYHEMHFVFCSAQCEERFLANPHLYVGQPGEPAPAQQGRVMLKRRRIQLAQCLSADQASTLVNALEGMMGVRAVQVNGPGDLIEVRYDLMQATERQIEHTLTALGVRLGNGWGERLRRGFVHYLEEMQVENMEVDPRSHPHRH